MVCVNRCVCTGLSIKDLVQLARDNNYTHDQLIEATNAGNHCGLCRPYVKCALETGQVVFNEIIN